MGAERTNTNSVDLFVLQNLLEIVHDLFEEQTSLEKVILKIMQRAQRLLLCQRAAVLLLDDTSETTKFSKLFELTTPFNGHTHKAASHSKEPVEAASRHMLSLAEKVAISGEVLNVAECLEVEKGSGGDVKSLLAMPIRNSHYQIIGENSRSAAVLTDSLQDRGCHRRYMKVLRERRNEFGAVMQHVLGLLLRVLRKRLVMNRSIIVRSKSGTPVIISKSDDSVSGVATIINKLNGQPFDENDEQLFEAFTIFCGLGIHNTIMYSEVEKAMARQRVALEVLSYHATASSKEVEALMVTAHVSFSETKFDFTGITVRNKILIFLQDQPVPCADDLNLYSLTFDDFSLEPDEMVKGAAAMFLQLGLVKRFAIEKGTLYRFLITVKRNYRDVPYHNWRHAFNVSQVMFAILMVGRKFPSLFAERRDRRSDRKICLRVAK